jgi:uncharacterized protein (DUF1810 family)
MMADSFNLERFVVAQDANDSYARALDELRKSRKTSQVLDRYFDGKPDTATDALLGR